jgi:F0F1-type ATP synthase membrane subunit b/b'
MMTRNDLDGRGMGSWWLPVILVVVAFFVLLAFETGYAIHDRQALADQRRSQEQAGQEALKLRQQLEALAGKTAQLAAEGDEGAKAVVDQMKRHGVDLTVPKQ